MASRAFGLERAKKGHLVRDGKGGIAGEVGDLRSDVDNGFEAVELEIDTLSSRQPVRLATAAALGACTAAGAGVGKTLTQNAAAVENIDGNAVVVGDRVLVKDQVAGEDNGIYVVTTVGTAVIPQVLTRATDADASIKVKAALRIDVEEGAAALDTTWGLTTNNPIVLDTTALVFAEALYITHADRHARGGTDEIDGDHLDIDMTPAAYTPDVTPAEAANVDDLAAHLYGIDLELADVVQDEGCAASVQIIQAGQPNAGDAIVIGVDTYTEGVDFAIAGNAEQTMDALLAAIVAGGTEDLFADKLSAARLRLRAADAPQGVIVGANPSVVLVAAGIVNYTFDAGDVDMNTLAGRVAAKRAKATVVLTITAALLAATPIRIAFPFTPTMFETESRTAVGAVRIAAVDSFAIVGDDVEITLPGGGNDLAATDVLTLTVYE